MSNAKQCDRCGGYFKPVLKRPPMITWHRFNIDRYTDIELCPQCAGEFLAWVNKYQTVAEVDDR